MYRQLVLLAALALGACTLPQTPVPELPTPPHAAATDVETLQAEVAWLRDHVAQQESRMQELDGWMARLTRIETVLAGFTNGRKGAKPSRDLTPAQVVAKAQRDSRVEPSERGYLGRSAEQVYTWQPGGLYVIYLTASHPTALSLPPGELAVIGLKLDPDLYDIEHKRVGQEPLAYEAITVRPKFEKGEVDVPLWTKSGRRYLFHFVIGTWGMAAVTFEGTPVIQEPAHQQKLILPKPPQ
jgi:hypothetical protein